jgi:hypothetical protein
MKRNLRIRICSTIGLGACLAGTAFGQGVNVEVNGQRVYFPAARPQMVGGRVLVPLRGVLEQLGAYVDWDSGSRMVTARKGEIDIQMRIGDRNAIVNGRTMFLDSPAMIIQGSTMVPLRFMSEALGADVDWIAQTNTVRINTLDVSQPPNFPPYNPPPVTGVARINSFTVDAPYATLRAGDMVRMELRGTPAADVHFSIPGVTPTKRMREESPGFYVAEWTVPTEAEGRRESAIVAKLIYRGDEQTMRAVDDPGDVAPPRDSTPPTITAMVPANGARIGQARPTIRVRVGDANGSGLNLDSWRLTLDGDDVTDQAGYSNGMITYQPTNRLTRGLHTVQLTIEDKSGNRASSSWQFEITRDTEIDRRNATFSHDAASIVRAGDVVTFTLRAEPEARVTYSIGNLVVDRAMTESSPGVYTARYTVRRGDDFRNMPIVARVRLDDGTSYTVEAERFIESPGTRLPSTPTIIAPTGSRVGETIVLRARSANAERYEVRIDYVTTVLGGLRLNGTVHQRTYEADSRGELRTDPIDLDVSIGGSNTEYTITVTAVSSDGTRSEPAKMTVRR